MASTTSIPNREAPPPCGHRTAAILRILPLLLLVTTGQRTSCSAFAPALSPSTGRRTSLRIAAPAYYGDLRRTSTERPAFFTADAEEVHRHKKSSSSDDGDDGSWTPVEGGFLPNYSRPTAPSSPPASRTTRKKKQKGGVVQEVVTLQDYKKVVADEPDKITAVRFHAPWCRACRAARSRFRKLARKYADDDDRIQFVEVPLTSDNAVLHEGLGIPSLPYGHVYHPEAGLVEERRINKNLFADYESSLDSYVRGYCRVRYTEDGTGNEEETTTVPS